jgi:oxygen-independent coproporphyrinogen III oxidase
VFPSADPKRERVSPDRHRSWSRNGAGVAPALIFLKGCFDQGAQNRGMPTLSPSALVPEPAFDAPLVAKYDTFGPRYTSYPTADRFTNAVAGDAIAQALATQRDAAGERDLSLYVHVPFCSTICYYCACNKVVTKDHGRSAKYIHYIAREADRIAALSARGSPVRQLHWGGGTPTFLSNDEAGELMRILRKRFEFAPDAECSIEVDPRSANTDTVAALAALGFNRMSLGVQDFDPAVQRSVNRIQSEEETLRILDAARATGFRSVNLDLIYGLPLQTPASFAATLDKVIAAAPDRIALYNYAHVPHLFKPQRRISESDLPSPSEKLVILGSAIDCLRRAGYVYIGMDHFAKPDDELARAQRDGTLHRNFQGYSTRAGCDLIALGISAISHVGDTYWQNVRTLDPYYERLDAGELPGFRGWRLSSDDAVRSDVIQALLCRSALSFAEIEATHGIVFADYFETELEALRPLADDGLVAPASDGIVVTSRGRLLARAVAMVFDRYLREQREGRRYSRVI